MKILRNSALLLLGLSLSVPAAFACNNSSPSGEWFHHVTHPDQPDDDRDCDHHDCDHDRDGRDCNHQGAGGSTTTGGTGDITNPPSPKS